MDTQTKNMASIKSQARKTSALPTRIWSFHAKPPTEGGAVVTAVLRRNGEYYNTQIRSHRDNLERVTALQIVTVPAIGVEIQQLADLENQFDSVYDEIREWRRLIYVNERRTTRDTSPEHTKLLAELREQQKGLRGGLSALQKEFRACHVEPARTLWKQYKEIALAGKTDPHSAARANATALTLLRDSGQFPVGTDVLASEAQVVEEHKIARQKFGLPPGCGIAVDDAVKASVKDSFPDAPKWRRSDGGGKITVQTKDFCMRDLLGSASTNLRLTCTDERRAHYDCWIRVGSDSERNPIWAKFPVKMHRMPPDDSIIKWASVIVRRIGDRLEYKFQLTLEHASFVGSRPEGVGEVDVRVKWSRRDDGSICVATANGEDVLIPVASTVTLLKARALTGSAKRYYEEALTYAHRVSCLGGHQLSGWHRLASDFRRCQFRAFCEAYALTAFGTDELRETWKQWKDLRFAEGLDLYCRPENVHIWIKLEPAKRIAFYLYLWARKDRHLREWERQMTRHGELARDEVFRREAIRLATRYHVMVHDGMSIADLAKRAEIDERDVLHKSARGQRVIAAPGRFREVLIEVFGGKKGGRVIERERVQEKPITSRKRKSAKNGEAAVPM